MKKIFFIIAFIFVAIVNAQNPDIHRRGVIIGSFASDPTGVSEGQIYWNSTSKIFRQYNGTTWNDLAGSGGTINIEDEGVLTVTAATILDFVGSAVTVTDAGGGRATITVVGGSESTTVSDTATVDLTLTGSDITADVITLTTKGDIYTFGTSDARLPVGTDGQVIEADNTEPTGLKWVTPQKNNDVNSTGLLSGGVLSVGAGASEYSISDGTGQIVDQAGNKTLVSWSGKTNITPTNILGGLISFIGIDISGNVVEQLSDFTPLQTRSIIALGVVLHFDNTTVNGVNNEQHPSYNVMSQLYDLGDAIGFFNTSGNVFSPNGVNLSVDKSVGTLFKMGSNYDTDINNPHNKTLPAKTATPIIYRFSDGTPGATGATIDPNNIDNNSGGLTALSNNQWSVQRIYSFISNNVIVQRGAKSYSNKADAINGIATENYITEPSIKANGLLRAWLVVKEGATDLSNINDAEFIEAPKFGSGSGTAGGASQFVPTQLSDLTDVNTSTPTNRNVLVADGVDFESRALVEADISDLGAYLTTEVDGSTTNEIQNLSNANTGVDHTLSISSGLGSIKLAEGTNINLVTTGTAQDGVVTINATGDGTGTDDQTASEVNTNTAGFNGNLSGTDTTVQLALDTIDDLVIGGGANQLSDLTDVNTSTPTNRNVLVADGVDWESRALTEADISDLGTYLTTEVDGSTTNELNTGVTMTAGSLGVVDAGGTQSVSLISTDGGNTITAGADGKLYSAAGAGESTTVSDTAEIDLTLTGSDITAAIVTGSIDVLKLDSGVQTSLGLADTALQSEVDGSTTNELQTIANTSNAASHTATLSNSGGSLQLVEGSNITLTTSGTGLDGIVTITSTASGADGLGTDGDKGDITVGGTGTTLTIDNDAVTYAKMQNSSVGFTVLGKTATGSGDFAEIVAGTDGVLRRSGTGNLTFGSLVTNNYGNNTVSLGKMSQVATQTFLGRNTAATGNVEALSTATAKTMLNLSGTNSGDQTSIVGITGTKAQFDTAVTDGNFLYVGDVTSNATHTGEVTGATALTIASGVVDSDNITNGTIDELDLDTSVNATLDLADSSVQPTGTPVNNQLALWTNANTLEGTPHITYDGSTSFSLNVNNGNQGMFTMTNLGVGVLQSSTSLDIKSDALSIESGAGNPVATHDGNNMTFTEDIFITSGNFVDTNGTTSTTGTALDLSDNITGKIYNEVTPSTATAFTTTNLKVGGFAYTYINSASEPTVNGSSTETGGAVFQASTLMKLVAYSPDGTTVEHWFVDLGTPSAASSSPLTTKGDLYTYSTVDARLGVGTNGQVLTADSAEPTGLKWAAPTGGGDVTKVGTPVNNQVGVWTGDGTIEGDTNFTYDGTNLSIGTGDFIDTNGTASTTGTVLDLSDNITGKIYNETTPSTATAFTTTNLKTGGFAITYINSASEPTVNGSSDEKGGSVFTASVVMKLVVYSPDGTTVEHFFVSLATPSSGGSESTTVGDTAEIDLTLSGSNITGTLINSSIGLARLSATGTPSASTYLRGDNTWASIAGGGDVTKVGTPVLNQSAFWDGDGTLRSEPLFAYNGTTLFDFGKSIQIDGRVIADASTDAESMLKLEVNDANKFALGNELGLAGTGTNNDIVNYVYNGALGSWAVWTSTLKRFQIDGNGAADFQGNSVTAGSFIKDSGTASQFLKADGSVDSSTYLTTEVDGSVSNEGSLTVAAGAATTSIINSNTSGSTGVTLTAGNGLSISEAGNVITLTNTAATKIGSKSITIESPTATEDISMFFTNGAITISEMRAVVRGTTPSVTWTIRHSTDRSAVGNEVVTGGTATTSQTTGSDVFTGFNDNTIPADSFVWVETTAQTGTVDELSITIIYSED